MTFFLIIPTLTIGGAESICMKTCVELKKNGVDVQLITFSDKVDYIVPSGILLTKFVGFIGFCKYLRFCYVNRFNGIFISYMERANLYNVLSYIISGVRKVCLTVHTAPRTGFKNRKLAKQIYIHILYKICGYLNLKVLTVSRGIASELNSLYGINNVKVLYNFIDVEEYSDVINFRTCNNNVSSKCLSLLFVGRLAPVKGCDVLLESLKSCTERKDITLTIVGDGPMRKTYEIFVKNEGLSEQVRFVGAVNDVKTYMLNAQYLVIPSYAEGFGMVVLEGLLSGCNIIYSECDFGPKELMTRYFFFAKSYSFFDPSISRSKSINDLTYTLSVLPEYSFNLKTYEHVVCQIRQEFSADIIIKKLKLMVD
ncbi:glycosyltransferase [Shewanella mangrovisoli]|uniref:glycosyltransferase n=1 Tax=Shewanella mangrovisoli TaxID=2864211 RepID=UPI0035BAA3B2